VKIVSPESTLARVISIDQACLVRRLRADETGQARSILHVDDEPDFLRTAKPLLEMQAAFQVDTGLFVEEATEKMKETAYDCVACDYVLPGKDGLRFLKELRDSKNDIPFRSLKNSYLRESCSSPVRSIGLKKGELVEQILTDKGVLIVPVSADDLLKELDSMAERMGEAWPKGVSAVEAVREDREKQWSKK